ncbi:MAG TPA: RpiB/LacA/LacB family sugar-phosphate isomerase [Tepidisphaeraceae bacterium]|jgi:ribose 5-phosphate isomerase RpiB
MIVTARQLEDMHKSAGGSGKIVLPYRAKLTPLAKDFIKAKKIELGYADSADRPAGGPAGSPALVEPVGPLAGNGSGAYLWWSDGPAGPAKAAMTTEERQSGVKPLAIANDEANLINAIRAIAKEMKSGNTAGAVLLVKSGARAMVFANRCPSIRAVLGTCMETVEQGIDQIAANVLVIEHPHKNLSQIRNLLTRFLHRPRKLSPQIEQQLKELASCG